MKPPKIDAPFLEIVWNDAGAPSVGWASADEVSLEHQLVITRGYLFKEDDLHIILCSTGDGSHFHGHFQIPKGMIVSRDEMDVRRKRKPKAKPDGGAEGD